MKKQEEKGEKEEGGGEKLGRQVLEDRGKERVRRERVRSGGREGSRCKKRKERRDI